MDAPRRPSLGEPPERGTDARARGRDPLPRDLQSLLAAATRRLVASGAGATCLAWARRGDGTPYVAAAAGEGASPQSPSRGEFAELAALTGAVALGGADAPPARRALGERHGCSAAAAVRSAPGEPIALLLLGGDPRPRALAALEAAARRLEGPAAAAASLARLERLDGEVRELDRLAALGRLASEIVHEVRNPLVSIKTFLQLLPERRDDPELVEEFLELANAELRRMERLLDLVIGQARPASGETTRGADTAAVLEGTAELLRHHALQRGVALRVDAPADLPRAALGEDALRQVVLNLALNAVDATADGGEVALAARARAGGLVLSVRDRGPGIPVALRDAVFEPFFSTRGDRSGGLGLAIARRLVEEAGGRIAVAEAEGGGALFRVGLPATPESSS